MSFTVIVISNTKATYSNNVSELLSHRSVETVLNTTAWWRQRSRVSAAFARLYTLNTPGAHYSRTFKLIMTQLTCKLPLPGSRHSTDNERTLQYDVSYAWRHCKLQCTPMTNSASTQTFLMDFFVSTRLSHFSLHPSLLHSFQFFTPSLHLLTPANCMPSLISSLGLPPNELFSRFFRLLIH